ncbi:MAG: hypothetical protein KDA78_10970 [Planctomycetaceae bacterium]|nr:hypothetical protein [Planctomycetaceae bacterium]
MLKEEPTDVLVADRRAPARRGLSDRRKVENKDSIPATGDRRKVERRRQIDPTTCERDYSGDEVEFMRAIDDYKRRSGRQFPTWSEVLEVIRDLGYRKIAEPTTTFVPEQAQ